MSMLYSLFVAVYETPVCIQQIDVVVTAENNIQEISALQERHSALTDSVKVIAVQCTIR